MNYSDRLKTLDGKYDEASDLDYLPLGKHEVEVVKSTVDVGAKSPDLFWHITFENEDGRRPESINLEKESVLWKVKQTAKKLGYDGNLSGLAQWAPVAVGAKVFIEVFESENKNDPDNPYRNTKIVKLLSPGKGEPLKEAPAPAPIDDMDSIPF